MIGFRSDTPWKKLIALSYYCVCFLGFKLGVEEGVAILISAVGIPFVVTAAYESVKLKRRDFLYIIPVYIVLISIAWYFTYTINTYENKETVAVAESSATTTVNLENNFDENEIVYVTKKGSKYHKQDCSSIKNSKVFAVNVRQAIENEKIGCEKCFS